MAPENELSVIRPEKRAASSKLSRRLTKLTNTALDCLEEILTDESAKSSDRITAVKLTFDLVKQQTKPEDTSSGEVKVIFEGIPREWAE